MGLGQGGVDRKVGRRTGIGLHVDAPLFGVESVRLEGTLLCQYLNLVDELVAAVVPIAKTKLSY